MDDLQRLFLTIEPLKRVLVYMCSGAAADPITETVKSLLTQSVQFSVSRYGLGLLKSGPVFPFSHMNAEQRQHLYELMRAIGGGDDHHSAFACIEDPLTYWVENDRVWFNGTVSLDPKLVFDALLQCVHDTGRDATRMRLLTSLLLQRIGGKVPLTRETLVHIEAESQRLFTPGAISPAPGPQWPPVAGTL